MLRNAREIKDEDMSGALKRIRVVPSLVVAGALCVLIVSCAQDRREAAVEKKPEGASTAPGAKVVAATDEKPEPMKWREMGFSFAPAPDRKRSAEEVAAGSASCVACHVTTDSHSMHESDQGLSCVDCHGGFADLPVPKGIETTHPEYKKWQQAAHVKPRFPELWHTSRNPEGAGPETLDESVDFIRFINPGDLRASHAACASCHPEEVRKVEKSMMTHGAMLWSAALYNNGSINRKIPVYGESYTTFGEPRQLIQRPAPTKEEMMLRGILPALYPMPRWEITQPGNVLRVFERGGKVRPQIGLPNPLLEVDPGRPDVKLSVRGFGTDVRTDPVFIGLQKTRLFDPTLNMLGTNDHPGDYRSSGCTACHVVYANDRNPVHSGRWAQYGNMGLTATKDPTIPKGESGHPIEHKFVRNMPTSTCIVCHVHPGTNVVNSYLGYTWWDNESDGEFMYPKKQKNPSAEIEYKVSQKNPEQAAARGLWSNMYPNAESHAGIKAGEKFLENLTDLNPKLQHVQFADFHGHGWVFRAVHKRDRKGNLLDKEGKHVAFDDPNRWDKSVHLKDIHLEKGMHCTDCHFSDDNHGDGNLYGETRNAVIVSCEDCHGGVKGAAGVLQYLNNPRGAEGNRLATAAFTGNMAPKTLNPEQLQARKNLIQRRFEIGGDDRLVQKSAIDPEKKWNVVQFGETVNPKSPWVGDQTTPKDSPRLARYAHTVRKDGKSWGTMPTADEAKGDMALAHGSNMSCYSCHTSWNTSCFGCHLPMRANQRKTMLHNEAAITRNYTNYNFQTLRDDVYMLGIDSTVKQHQIVPIRSACAVLVSSQDANRQWLYTQQQTVSAEGFAGTAFSPYFPHTVRGVETKTCTDCHISKENDNNAIMAQLLLHGTNSVNFIGRYAWVACEDGGFQGVAVAELNEPQAVIGSKLHELAYPDDYKKHAAGGGKLTTAHTHHGEVLDVQLRGEYLYTACGHEGFIAYDVANVENKGFSERLITSPVSPLGQKFYVKTRYATSVCSPSTMAIDPTRPKRPENEEGPIHLMYAFLYVTDKYEGMVVIGNPLNEKTNRPGVATLLDGNPSNNFLKKALSFNPDGILNGAKHMAIYGTYAYIAADAGLVVVDLNNPLEPKHVTTVMGLNHPRKVTTQFRYAFVTDADGVKVLDITYPAQPRLLDAKVEIEDARDIYVARTYGYVAAGKDGLVILDLEKPEQPKIDQTYNADGKMNDATGVKIGMTNSSLYAYVADGHNGIKVIQLTGAEAATPGYLGFSPRPAPRLISWFNTQGKAVAISEGLDRDRAVDEAGNQLAVFGRRGARPFNLQEQQRLYFRKNADGTSSIYTVTNAPETDPLEYKLAEPAKATQPAPPPRRSPFPRRNP